MVSRVVNTMHRFRIRRVDVGKRWSVRKYVSCCCRNLVDVFDANFHGEFDDSTSALGLWFRLALQN